LVALADFSTLQHASPDLTIPVIDVKDLPSYDGILFGLCTRFGMASAQMKAVMDATGTLFTLYNNNNYFHVESSHCCCCFLMSRA
jgi:multimeric flavodoxin WrbA